MRPKAGSQSLLTIDLGYITLQIFVAGFDGGQDVFEAFVLDGQDAVVAGFFDSLQTLENGHFAAADDGCRGSACRSPG